MSEFRIHHDVNELLSLLRVHGGEGAEVYIDLLQKNRTPYVTTTVSAHSAKVRFSVLPSQLRCVSDLMGGAAGLLKRRASFTVVDRGSVGPESTVLPKEKFKISIPLCDFSWPVM